MLLLLSICLGPPTLLFPGNLGTCVHAQIPNPTSPADQVSQAQIMNELRQRGIDEVELRARLIQEGIDLNALTPEELVQLRPRIEEIVAQLEAEQAAEAEPVESDPTPQPDADIIENPEAIETPEPAPKSDAPFTPSLIYGHDLLRGRQLSTIEPSANATPPDSYPLRPGDELTISIFGQSNTDLLLRLGPNGFVRLPNGSAVALGGVPLGQARELLAGRLKQIYSFRDGQLSIRTQVARTVSVSIFGEVERNGTYNLSSLNSAFNALVAAGGATETGSVRNIKMTRGDEVIEVDVYEFLDRPIQATDLFLSQGATIFVPPAQTIVEVRQGVLRPLFYELKDGETITDLLRFAGGLLPSAEKNNIRVTRYQGGMNKLINVDLDADPDFVLRNGDVVLVPVVEEPIDDFVTVEGAVLLPGPYAFEEGMTVGELVTIARLRPGARRDVAFLFSKGPSGATSLRRVSLGADAGAMEDPLARGDRLRILTEDRFRDVTTVRILGAVREGEIEIPFPDDGRLTIDEAILLSGGLLPNAREEAMIIRTPLSNREDKIYERINLITNPDFALQPLDQVQIYSNERYNDTVKVVINGAVRQPGQYTYNPSLGLQDLIYLAGGTTIDAALNRVEIFRLNFENGLQTRTLVETIDLSQHEKDYQLQAYDEVVIRSAAEFETIRNVVVQGEVRYPGQYALISDNERLSSIINRAGGLTAEAFPEGATLFRPRPGIGTVVLELQRVIANPADPANVVLLDRDTISVPKRSDLVRIIIQNTNATSFGVDSTTRDGTIDVAFQGERSAKWYLDNYAGGYDEETAFKRGTTVQYANGQIKETKSFLGLRSYPKIKRGAIIQVATAPPEVKKERREERFDWLGLAQIIVGAAASITTIILVRR